MLEEFLYDVIAEYVLHKLKCIRFDFSKDLIFLIAVCSLKFFLYEPRAMLVAAKLDDVVVDILRLG